jgi:DNA ligase-associated metallophosphoesterase
MPGTRVRLRRPGHRPIVPGIRVFLFCEDRAFMAGTISRVGPPELWRRRASPAMTRIAVDVASRSSLNVAGVDLVADLSGALFWEEQRLLVVSDLHLEKGSSFAARGVLLPPYDTVATLGRLAAVVARHDPRMVIALGDSFHDRDAHHRLSAPDRGAIAALQARRDWIWISGNHDPALPPSLGGVIATEVAIGPIAFRHEPTGAEGEIAGHLHPKARVSARGRSMERRCFACDGERAVMPAFGAYTGGLNIRDAAFAKIFQTLGFMAHVLGDSSLHTIAASRCY